jgi:hypothetical protein
MSMDASRTAPPKRQPLGRVLVNLLAIVGALTILGALYAALADRFGDTAATGAIENEDGSPAVGVPVSGPWLRH